MKALIAALALATLIAVPMFAQPANAPPVPPASSSFGSTGYFAPATAASNGSCVRRMTTHPLLLTD